MSPDKIKDWLHLCSLRPRLCSALLTSLAIVLLGGCTSINNPGPSPETSAREPLNTKEIDPATRERIATALGRDADEDALRDSLKQQPGNVDAAIPLARALLAHKRPDEALEVLDNVLRAVPGDLRALNAKGVALDSEGRHREAQALYRQALAAEPANPILRNNLRLSLALDGTAETSRASQPPRTSEPQ